ncbi:hypothetical protein Pfo_026775 [Paulownia fortunei]|nr:hypothetical protein Pfo_026775 [Paulownia fortunei]
MPFLDRFVGIELQTVAFTLKQIGAATNNFDATNNIGEGDQLLMEYEYMENNSLAYIQGKLIDARLAKKILDWLRLNEDAKTHISTKIAGTIFGSVILEIVSGKRNNDFMPYHNFICLLDWKVALLCTNATPSIRPTMSEVVQMLKGKMVIPDVIPKRRKYNNGVRFKAEKDFHQERRDRRYTWSQSQNSTMI